MRRNIFHDGEIKRFQQGSLFYGAIVDNLDYAVWGVIITPRCDIEQNKVSTVNYLPIIKFADWKNLHLLSIYQAEELTKRKANLKQIFESKNIPQNLLDVKYRLSVDDLSKIFSKETGVPVKRFIVTAKVNTAKNMLVYSDFTLSEIAMSLGFSSQSALSAAFKKVTRQTPAKFRNMYREQAEE